MFILKSTHRAALDKATAEITETATGLAIENQKLKKQIDDLTNRLAKTTLRAMNAEKKNSAVNAKPAAQKRLAAPKVAK